MKRKKVGNLMRLKWLLPYTVVALQACSDSLTTPVISNTVSKSSLTDAAALGVMANGSFVLPIYGNSEENEISAERAREIAVAFWVDAKNDIRNVMDSDRGAKIHALELRPCPRTFYAASAYERVTADVRPVVRKSLGAQWIVGMCFGDVEEVAISVSALATDVQISSRDHRIVRHGVNNFSAMGVPVGTEIPTKPERVANMLASASKLRVSTVPRLVRQVSPASPMLAVWQVDLESGYLATDTRTRVASQHSKTIYVGPLNGWSTPAFADVDPKAGALNSRSESFEYENLDGTVSKFSVNRRDGTLTSATLLTFGANQ